MDVDARVQLFDLKTKYQFMTSPGIDRYRMPLYKVQVSPGSPPLQQSIYYYPVYQGFMGPCTVNGIEIPFYTETSLFQNIYPNYVNQTLQVATGDGTKGPYSVSFPFANSSSPNPTNPSSTILRAFIDNTGLIALYNAGITSLNVASGNTGIQYIPGANINSQVFFSTRNADGKTIVVQDSGMFLDSADSGCNNYGLLMSSNSTDVYPTGYTELDIATSPNNYSITKNTINYFTGSANFYFLDNVPSGMPIMGSAVYYQMGLPRGVLFYDNVLTFRAPPNTSYLVELTAYLSPAAFLATTQAIEFAYMCEYIARGAARKILSDIGDWEQFTSYEPLFIEQERLVWKRSQRQFTATRTQTIYSDNGFNSPWGKGTGMGAY